MRDTGLDRCWVFAHENDRHPRGAVYNLFHHRGEFCRIAALIGDGNGVNPELLAHAVDLGSLHRFDLLRCRVAGL